VVTQSGPRGVDGTREPDRWLASDTRRHPCLARAPLENRTRSRNRSAEHPEHEAGLSAADVPREHTGVLRRAIAVGPKYQTFPAVRPANCVDQESPARHLREREGIAHTTAADDVTAARCGNRCRRSRDSCLDAIGSRGTPSRSVWGGRQLVSQVAGPAPHTSWSIFTSLSARCRICAGAGITLGTGRSAPSAMDSAKYDAEQDATILRRKSRVRSSVVLP